MIGGGGGPNCSGSGPYQAGGGGGPQPHGGTPSPQGALCHRPCQSTGAGPQPGPCGPGHHGSAEATPAPTPIAVEASAPVSIAPATIRLSFIVSLLSYRDPPTGGHRASARRPSYRL